MASIKEYLDQIRLAIYGEEVRGSIINAITAINNESSSASQSASQSAASSRESANSAAQSAQMVGKYDRMTVSVTELLPSQAPTVEMTEDSTKKHLSFGIPQGEQGLKGDKGDTGDTGPVGPQGIQGLKGDKGDTGDTGPVGPQGIQGEQGIQGDPGPTPQITVNVETGAPGTQASVVQTGTAEAPILTFTIPKGDTGAVDGLPLGNTPAKPLGSNASAGVSEEASRLDHIHPLPSADDLSVVSYSEQVLTDDQKAQARTNIGAGTSSFSGSYNDLTNKPSIPTSANAISAVSYNSQTLTEAQKAQARTNIGAGTSSFSGSYNDLTNKPSIPTSANAISAVSYNSQTLTEAQKAQARTNIGAGTSSFSGSYNDLTNKPSNINASTLSGVSLAQIKDILEPVGTIFEWCPVSDSAVDLSTAAKVAAYKGFGTWQNISGRFLYGANSSNIGTTGGESAHRLIEAELPMVTGSFTSWFTGTSNNVDSQVSTLGNPTGVFAGSTLGMLGVSRVQANFISQRDRIETVKFQMGSGQAHNNMPPYKAVYIWQRIA